MAKNNASMQSNMPVMGSFYYFTKACFFAGLFCRAVNAYLSES